jgi:magnesium-transporting ATPase (P-type)
MGTKMTCSPNENQFVKFISYFRGPILYVMELAVVLAAGLQDWLDFGIIIGILMVSSSDILVRGSGGTDSNLR